MGYTVLEMLCAPAFSGSSLLAGFKGLDRAVTAVTVAEVPDSNNWIEPGELVLSTAFLFRDQSDALVEWLRNLNEAGAACVAIKPQRFLGRFSAQVCQVADQLGLPLVALPFGTRWPDLIRSVCESIFYSDSPDRPSVLGEKPARLIASGAGMGTLAQSLSQAIQGPVVIQDTQGKTLAVGMPGGDTRLNRIVSQWLASLSASHAVLKATGKDTRPWLERTVHLDGYSFIERAYPVVVGMSNRGAVISLLVNPTGSEPQSMEKTLQLWSAAISLVWEQRSGVRQRPISEVRSAFREALTDEVGQQQDAKATQVMSMPGVVICLEIKGDTVPVDVVMAASPGSNGLISEPTDRLVLEVERWAGFLDHHAQVVDFDWGIALVFHIPRTESFPNFIIPRLRELRQVAKSVYRDSTPMIGVGEPASTPAQYRMSLGQARFAMSWVDGNHRPYMLFRELGIFRFLGDSGDRLHQVHMSRDMLSPLLAVGGEDEGLLLETLTAYFKDDCDIRAAAQRLHLHPNSLRYRLHRIEELTGMSMRSVADKAQLYMAVRLTQLAD